MVLSPFANCKADHERNQIIGKTAKNVSEEEAMDYVLGYTAANDVSARTSQFKQSQWCFSKGFDTACPIGVSPFSKDLCNVSLKLYF